MTKSTITANNTTSDFFINPFFSAINTSSCLLMSSSRCCGFALRSFLKSNFNKISEATNETATAGPMLIINELKLMFAAEPISMFGGSPISVAAPPTFEVNTWARINGIGDRFKILKTEIVTGTISRTAVTLSMNIDDTAVNVPSKTSSVYRLPFEILLNLMPIYWKIPVSAKMATIIIIPSKSPIVLKSTEFAANSKLSGAAIIPVATIIMIIMAAPNKAITALWTSSNERAMYTDSSTIEESTKARLIFQPPIERRIRAIAERAAITISPMTAFLFGLSLSLEISRIKTLSMALSCRLHISLYPLSVHLAQ